MQEITTLLTVFGYTGFFVIIFLETALPVCFFLPGDTLLFVAGMLAAQGLISLPVLVLVGSIAAIAGGFLGFGLGGYLGKRIFSDTKKGILNTKNKERAELFYKKFGMHAVFFARFVPVVRTFISTIAGIAGMSLRSFSRANIFGGILWMMVILTIGFYLGEQVPLLTRHTPVIFGAVVGLSLAPVIYSWIKLWLKKKKIL